MISAASSSISHKNYNKNLRAWLFWTFFEDACTMQSAYLQNFTVISNFNDDDDKWIEVFDYKTLFSGTDMFRGLKCIKTWGLKVKTWTYLCLLLEFRNVEIVTDLESLNEIWYLWYRIGRRFNESSKPVVAIPSSHPSWEPGPVLAARSTIQRHLSTPFYGRFTKSAKHFCAKCTSAI